MRIASSFHFHLGFQAFSRSAEIPFAGSGEMVGSAGARGFCASGVESFRICAWFGLSLVALNDRGFVPLVGRRRGGSAAFAAT